MFFTVAAALGLTLIAGSAAQADTAPNPIPLAGLPQDFPTQTTQFPAQGGWSAPGHVAGISTWVQGGPPANKTTDPQVLMLNEPMYWAGGGQILVPFGMIGFHPRGSTLPDVVDPAGTGFSVGRDYGPQNTVSCIDKSGASVVYQIRSGLADYFSGSTSPYLPNSGAFDSRTYTLPIQLASGNSPDCAGGLLGLHVQVCLYASAIGPVACTEHDWGSSAWLTGVPYGGTTFMQLLCVAAPTASAACLDPVNIDGANFGAVCGSPPPVTVDFGYFASVAVYYGQCLFTPVNGWDQNHLVLDAWNSGPVGALTSAFRAAVPSGIVCGAVATIPFFGTSVVLDTCQVDMASGIVKTVVGWVIVLGIGALIVRRVLWSVGSKA